MTIFNRTITASQLLRVSNCLCKMAALTMFLSLCHSSARASTLAYWRFESGNLDADSSGNGHTLSINGAVSESSDVASNAPGTGSANFDGDSGFLVQTLSTLDLTNYNGLTVEFFAKFTSTTLDVFFAHNDPNTAVGAFYLDINEDGPGILKFSQSTSGGFETRTAPYPADGNWHHYALTVDLSGSNEIVKIFIDGFEEDTGGASINGIQNFRNDVFTIGSFPSQILNYHGQLDELRISSGILSPSNFLIGPVTNPVVRIYQQPASATAIAGGSAIFTVGAALTNGNSATLQYQWQKDGVNIPGATSSIYTRTNVAVADDGASFGVVVSGPGAAPVTSHTAQLIVSRVLAYWRFEPSDMAADSSGNGNTLNLSNVVSSSDVSTNASGTGSAVFDGSTSQADTISPLVLSPYRGVTVECFAKFNPGSSLGMFFSADDPNIYAGAFYLDYNETPNSLKVSSFTGPSWQTRFAPYPANAASVWHHYAMTIDESGSAPIFKIYVDGIRVDNSGDVGRIHDFLDHIFTIGSFPAVACCGLPPYNFKFTGKIDEMRVSSGVRTPDQFLIQLLPTVVILQQPASHTVVVGNPVTFTVGAVLTNSSPFPLQYQWQREGTNIPAATASSYTLATSTMSNNGSKFSVVVSAPGVAPVISSTATLVVTPNLNGIATVAYWRFEPGHLEADSSGNGHTLTNFALSSSSDVASNAAGTGSAVFDGSTTISRTLSTLDLSPFNALTIELFAKFTQNALGMFYSHNDVNLSAGAFYLDHDEAAGQLKVAQRGSSGFVTRTTPSYPTDGGWHHYAMTLDETGANTVVRIYVDGVRADTAGGTQTSINFRNDIFNIGSFPEVACCSLPPYTFKFAGEMDEMRISGGVLRPDEFLNAPPRLQINLAGGGALISWPDSPSGFSLKQADVLGGPWTAVTNTPVLSGTHWQVTIPTSSGAKFYRLAQ